jgi:hypothetical protein
MFGLDIVIGRVVMDENQLTLVDLPKNNKTHANPKFVSILTILTIINWLLGYVIYFCDWRHLYGYVAFLSAGFGLIPLVGGTIVSWVEYNSQAHLKLESFEFCKGGSFVL